MAITKEKKQESVVELKDLMGRSQAVILTEYRGLTAGQMAMVRNRLRPFNSRFMVAKNTLVARSLTELGNPAPEDLLKGPTALGFCFGDFQEPVRALMDLARETDILTIKGGLVGHSVLNKEGVQALTTFPSTNTLRAMVVGGLQSPASGFVGVLDGALRGLLYVLDARTEQMGEAAA